MPDTFTRRTPSLRWLMLAVVLTLGGAGLLVNACTAAQPGPPTPPASAAGTVDGEAMASSSGTRLTTAAPGTSSTTGLTGTPPGTSPAMGASTGPSPKAGRSTARPPTSRAPVPHPASAAVTGPVLPAAAPVSLAIPAIGVTSSLIRLGLDPDGSIQVPSLDDPHSPAGWFTESPTPGQQGPSIILGHIDSRAYGPGVFYRLGDLRPGDSVDVTRADGTVAVFRIDGVRTYPKNAFPTLQVYGNIDHAGLRLITCGGVFDDGTGHYRDNIVAFASLVSSHQVGTR